jgi:eukaryotic-like serine/threonine-protein kinase
MAEVYRARDTRLGRDIALKVVNESLAGSPELVRRFEQEARIAGSLNHPNLVAVYDFGLHDGAPYFITELLEGESLRQRLSRGRIPVQTALDWAARMAHGLAAAHAHGIVHRDVKPDNVFIGSDGQVKLLDFGIAKLAEAAGDGSPHGLMDVTVTPTGGATRTGSVLGTPGYMSPEQVRGEPVDARTDIFSLGSVLYEMLSGRRAFSGASVVESGYEILHNDPEPLPAEVPPAVVQVVDRCLQRSRGAVSNPPVTWPLPWRSCGIPLDRR